jgi:ribonuclease J
VNVCIHRGARQIGGSCVELERNGERLILDLGLPLDAPEATAELLPDVPGLRHPDPSLVGIVLSHPHQDHHGLMRFVPPSTPIFMGAAAERILKAAAPFVPGAAPLQARGYLRDGVTLQVGPFRVTPYLVDHSAYDAYALWVESGGKTLFYSGDLRAHGRKAALFKQLLARAPRGVDALLLEGSSIGRLAAGDRFPTENELAMAFAELALRTEGAVLVCASAQNIDRVVTVFRAARRAERVLVIDLYSAAVLAATANPNVPQSFWDDVRLFVPHRQRVRVKKLEAFEMLHAHDRNRVYPEALAALAPKAMFLFRHSLAEDFERAECLGGARLVWSQWEGYRRHPSFAPFFDWQARMGIPMESLHTSGHASIADLQRLAKAIKPKRLVPIHSFEPGRYAEFFPNVECRKDGERWSL